MAGAEFIKRGVRRRSVSPEEVEARYRAIMLMYPFCPDQALE